MGRSKSSKKLNKKSVRLKLEKGLQIDNENRAEESGGVSRRVCQSKLRKWKVVPAKVEELSIVLLVKGNANGI